MNRYAVISGGLVKQVILAEQDFVDTYYPGSIQLPSDSPVGIGWAYTPPSTFAYVPPPKYVPQEVTMRQARLALHAAGMLTGVTTAINGLSEPAKTQAQIEWEYSNSLIRTNPFVATLGAALGLTSEQIDDLFISASQIQ